MIATPAMDNQKILLDFPSTDPEATKKILCSIPPKSFCYDTPLKRLNPSPTYLELAKLVGVNDRDLNFSFTGYRKWTCTNDKCVVEDCYRPMVRSGKFHPFASHKHVSRTVARCMPRVRFVKKELGAKYLLGWDLTCPKWVSKKLQKEFKPTAKKLRKAVGKFLKIMTERLVGRGCQLGGVYATHIWATKTPLEPHLHVHLELFDIGYNSSTGEYSNFKPNVPHLSVKGAWRSALVSVGLWNSNDRRFPDCYLHYLPLNRTEVIEDGKKRKKNPVPPVLNRLLYIFRRPLVDLSGLQELPKNIDIDWIATLFSYTPREVQVGFMVKLNTLAKKVECVIPNSISPMCPECGFPMLKGKFYPSNLPELPHLIWNKDHSWSLAPPLELNRWGGSA